MDASKENDSEKEAKGKRRICFLSHETVQLRCKVKRNANFSLRTTIFALGCWGWSPHTYTHRATRDPSYETLPALYVQISCIEYCGFRPSLHTPLCWQLRKLLKEIRSMVCCIKPTPPVLRHRRRTCEAPQNQWQVQKCKGACLDSVGCLTCFKQLLASPKIR